MKAKPFVKRVGGGGAMLFNMLQIWNIIINSLTQHWVMKYLINIEEVLSRDVVVEAESVEEAEQKAEQLYRTCKIVLNADYFVGTPTITCKSVM